MGKPDFTGVWTFNKSKSELQIPAPDSTIFTIEHHEPKFHLERTHVFEGKSDSFSIDLTTDGKVVEMERAELALRASLHWEGDTLVFDSTITRGGKQGKNLVRYQLAPDTQTFIANERFTSAEYNYENKWCFDKQ